MRPNNKAGRADDSSTSKKTRGSSFCELLVSIILSSLSLFMLSSSISSSADAMRDARIVKSDMRRADGMRGTLDIDIVYDGDGFNTELGVVYEDGLYRYEPQIKH